MNLFRVLIAALILSLAGAAVAADRTSPVEPPASGDAVHQLLARLARNLADQSRETYSYALTTLNPLYPGTANVVNSLNQYHGAAQSLQLILAGTVVSEPALRAQVSLLSLSSKQVAFAINALGGNPALNGLVSRWNQTVTILNQIKAFVPVGRDEARVANFVSLYR